MPNHLQHETSPYLLQHADNPVDWYPWSEEAFRRAEALMEGCSRVLCPVADFGEMNEGNRTLRDMARQVGKLEAWAGEGCIV